VRGAWHGREADGIVRFLRYWLIGFWKVNFQRSRVTSDDGLIRGLVKRLGQDKLMKES
jgi:hypothetical protein